MNQSVTPVESAAAVARDAADVRRFGGLLRVRIGRRIVQLTGGGACSNISVA